MNDCMNILYEPSSTRDDYGELVITASNPCVIPFYFEIPVIRYDLDENERYQEQIPAEDKIVFVFKNSIYEITPVLTKEYTNIKENVAFLVLGPGDLACLYGKRTYQLGVHWYGQNGKIKKVLIRDLPVKVEGVVQNVPSF